jgi:transposase
MIAPPSGVRVWSIRTPCLTISRAARRADCRTAERREAAEARASGAEAMVAHLKLMIAKLRQDCFGASSERGRKLLD